MGPLRGEWVRAGAAGRPAPDAPRGTDAPRRQQAARRARVISGLHSSREAGTGAAGSAPGFFLAAATTLRPRAAPEGAAPRGAAGTGAHIITGGRCGQRDGMRAIWEVCGGRADVSGVEAPMEFQDLRLACHSAGMRCWCRGCVRLRVSMQLSSRASSPTLRATRTATRLADLRGQQGLSPPVPPDADTRAAGGVAWTWTWRVARSARRVM